MIRIFTAVLVLFVAVGPVQAGMVTLNSQSVIEDDVIRLGDLFVNIGEKAEIPVGYAPALGRRAVFDAAWLNRIARAHRLDWQAGSRLDRVIVERASQTIGLAAIEAELSAALGEAGVALSREVKLDNPNLRLLVPVDVAPTVAIRDLRYNAGAGRFTGLLAAPAENPITLTPISGRIYELVEVPIPVRRIARGEVIREADIAWIEVRLGRVSRDTVRDAEELVGMTPRRGLAPDKPVRSGDVRRPVVIVKGSIVTMSLRTAYMTITARGRALDDGAQGETIRVMNTHSSKVIEAEVAAPGDVIVRPFARLATVRE